MKFNETIKEAAPAPVPMGDYLSGWPRSYYEEKDPSMRLAMLEGAIQAGIAPEEDIYRRKLFDMRYSPNRYGVGGYADNFMRCFMNFMVVTKNPPGRFGLSRTRKKAIKDLEFLGIGADVENKDLYEQILRSEFCHIGQLYIALSADSKQYRAVIFGIGRISDKNLIVKLRKDLGAAGPDTADLLDLRDEMKLWLEGLEEARSRMIPETEPLI
ncbi:MAG: hypothetical protein E7233_00125 [Lachnospiraceae bacterium]|nr:hypothetical protein [Lachnospiraceae bacterium]